MSKFDTGNLSYLRRNHGLLWRKSYPSWREIKPVLFPVVVIAFLLLCYGLVDANDRMVQAEIDAQHVGQMLVDLANGGTIIGDNFASKCENWISVTN